MGIVKFINTAPMIPVGAFAMQRGGGLVLVLKHKKKRFSIGGGIARLNQELSTLPGETECFKLISDGSFSTICFVSAVALKTKIYSLYVSTFAIGKKRNTCIESPFR